MKFIKNAMFIVLALLATKSSNAQMDSSYVNVDSLPLSLDSLDAVFLRNNLSILAQKYNIEAQDAQVLQAKLFPNPNFSVMVMPYNHDQKKASFAGKYGDASAQLSQLIQLAGKRNKSVLLAQANVEIAKLQFFDLLRTLKYTLYSDFYSLYYSQKSAAVYKEEISSLQNVVNIYNQQEGKGYVSEKEVVRIKGQLVSLQSEYNDLLNTMTDQQSDMRILLNIAKVKFVPTVNAGVFEHMLVDQYPYQQLVDSALVNRTDLRIAKTNTHLSDLNLAYQKALAVPDLTATANYSQNGGYIQHEVQVGVSMDLPFFNRNQGNIKTAKSQITIAKLNEAQTTSTVQEDVYRSLQKAHTANALYAGVEPNLEADFKSMEGKVLENYTKRNISLLDFLDFYDSYKDNVLQMNKMRNDKVQALQDINFYTATNFYK